MMIPYAGKMNNSNNIPSLIVKELVSHLRGSRRNITIDRYYTSIELTGELLTDFKLTMLGTISTNRRHLPKEMKSNVVRNISSTILAWNGLTILASYMPKCRKNVLVLSTEHDQLEVSDRPDKNQLQFWITMLQKPELTQ